MADLADLQAWQVRERYPEVLLRGPLFAVARRRPDRQWEIVLLEEGNPQAARDALGGHFAQCAETAAFDDVAVRDAYLAAAERLEWQAPNEMRVLGERYRLVRGDLFVRSGSDGPEPPRPTDPDPHPIGQGHRSRSRAEGFVLDPATSTGMAQGILRMEMAGVSYARELVPPSVYTDSVRARDTHPNVVLIPAGFAVAELSRGAWSPMTTSIADPQGARDTLSTYLRVYARHALADEPERREPYDREADRLERERADDAAVPGRRFRIVRVEGLVRVDAAGPELPRGSDWVPNPPPVFHEQELRDRERLDRLAAEAELTDPELLTPETLAPETLVPESLAAESPASESPAACSSNTEPLRSEREFEPSPHSRASDH